MDRGRYHDLRQLMAVISNPSLPDEQRHRADIAKNKIVKQLRDKKLGRMRERLIKAAANFDQPAQWRIENEINTYLKRARTEAGYYD